jgi:hypothetical protein
MTAAGKRPLGAELAQLGQNIAAAKQRARTVDLEHRQVRAQLAESTEAITEAYADGDEAKASKLSAARARLETGSVRDADEKLAGAQRAVVRAEADRTTFAVENVDGLLAERASDADAVAKAVEDAVAELGQAHARWNATATDTSSLLRLAGRNTGTVPRFPDALEAIVRDARRAGGVDVPLPLPRAQEVYAAKVAPEYDPDPEIRAKARQALLQANR